MGHADADPATPTPLRPHAGPEHERCNLDASHVAKRA